MDNNKRRTNIIAMYDRGRHMVQSDPLATDEEDATAFIVDMLDRLMRIATKEDETVLVYLLAMARTEAIESKKNKTKPQIAKDDTSDNM